ncbi:hypothetical protein WJ96_05400 [Burkholderia ubonensis]|uniref:Uncharacterized protein n=1 Tax=Burkholderia ubonensis TaxID=101571 RepID=A0AAW3MYV9_9BURK|nr:hypothetical protein [Burkholderia ubonensis]KVP98007.1 hypothetical protein WJ96_05400 [Burkholderia ubonensis]KVZ92704.1 hypothetical protein WL25_17060 [Burkholderia ubonensis]
MSISLKTRITDYVNSPTPGRVVLMFLGSMIALLLVTLAIGQLNLPYYGKTVWDLGIASFLWAFACISVMSERAASQFPFVTGALGVLWLTRTYLRVRRTGRYTPGRIDVVMAVVFLGLLGVYFVYQEQALPLQASFFNRVALFCAFAVMMFSFSLVMAHWEDALEAKESNISPIGITLFGCLVAGIATGGHGGDVASVSFWAFQLPNALLHLLASFGGLAMGIWFYEEVRKLSKGDAPAVEGQEPGTAAAQA